MQNVIRVDFRQMMLKVLFSGWFSFLCIETVGSVLFGYNEGVGFSTASAETPLQGHGSLSYFCSVFSTAMSGLIPSHKSSKLSANKPPLTSLARKPWARNTEQVHDLFKGSCFSVSRLPVSASFSAVGPSSCRCCAG